jgi:hypothetical protein
MCFGHEHGGKSLFFVVNIGQRMLTIISPKSCYCLCMCRPSAAWSFAVSASQTCQSLGYHSAVTMSALPLNARQENLRLFWAVYMTDKFLSLRMGRSSTLRDSDITVPRLAPDHDLSSSSNPTLPAQLEICRLNGRVYDDIYGPKALAEPQEVRVARAQALAADVVRATEGDNTATVRTRSRSVQALARLTRVHQYVHEARHPVFGGLIHDVTQRLDIVHNMSLLTLIYRAMPADKPSGMVFSKECIEAARAALENHEACVSLIVDQSLESDIVETLISWYVCSSDQATPYATRRNH